MGLFLLCNSMMRFAQYRAGWHVIEPCNVSGLIGMDDDNEDFTGII